MKCKLCGKDLVLETIKGQWPLKGYFCVDCCVIYTGTPVQKSTLEIFEELTKP